MTKRKSAFQKANESGEPQLYSYDPTPEKHTVAIVWPGAALSEMYVRESSIVRTESGEAVAGWIAVSRQEPVTPKYMLVPIEPTNDMLNCSAQEYVAWKERKKNISVQDLVFRIYRRMLECSNDQATR